MTIYYSAKNNGFYHSELEDDYKSSPDGWPDDAVAVSDEQYQTLLNGQANGKVITPDGTGKPVLTDPVIDWQARAEAQRQSLLTAANATMTAWEREESAGILGDDDKASLIEWTKYAKVLRKLDLSGVGDETGYSAITWPDKP
ncbi:MULTISPECIES: tail fiber assembly protein [unclassified Pantoea]|uniref:tail fiber assembly protein n=1 Tax=unclassified Pantoea TaxID=2630326 RepID=UPI0012318AB6|nr:MULTISPECIES: tail fiber assembly protein [unclassified Pantoea]KAA6105011.1 tail fiber assembly protein [Pantoea sp. Bo_14]KAA6108605.1 tail fiber assembly protein [Pantoea sp. Bo_11]